MTAPSQPNLSWPASYAVCRGIYSGHCSCEAHDRAPCDAILSMQRHCVRIGIQHVAKAELTRCELNRQNSLTEKMVARYPVRTRDERLGGAS